MIEFIQGDMFSSKFDILVNTVNCVGAMGKGVALVFKDTYPDMYAVYRDKCDRGEIRPGKLMEWKPTIQNDLTPSTIINFPTKRHYRDDSHYDDIEAGLVALREYLLPLGPITVGLPPLGCGNGGLDWSIVSEMIFEKLADIDAIVYAFEPLGGMITSTKVIEIPVKEEPIEKPKGAKEPKPKKVKEKKRPSDFEITRTILTRTHERKLPFLFKDMGEDSDILLFCTPKDEGEFTFGSPDIAVAIFEFTDPELSAIITGCMEKINGFRSEAGNQRIINVRDQMSELGKNKGESIDLEIHSNPAGSVWIIKKDNKEKERALYFCKVVDSLYNVQSISSWCKRFRPLLTTTDPAHLYYSYRHTQADTAGIMTLPSAEDHNHPLAKLYPHGFRTMVTKGFDVIVDKFLEEFPYPVIQEEMIVFQEQSSSVQLAHRVIAEGWRMILLRPNAIFFPTIDALIPSTGNHSL